MIETILKILINVTKILMNIAVVIFALLLAAVLTLPIALYHDSLLYMRAEIHGRER